MKSFTVSLSVSFSSDLPEHKEDPNDLSCDERAAQFQMLSTADCSTAVLDSHGTTMKSRTDMLQWRYKCCGSGLAASQRSACYVDFSHVCATPSSYTPGASYNDAKDCDGFMRHVVSGSEALAGKDFSSAFDCSSETQTNIDIVDGIAAECCGTGQSACAPDSVDYSAAVCKDKSSCTLCCCRRPLSRCIVCYLAYSFFSMSYSQMH